MTTKQCVKCEVVLENVHGLTKYCGFCRIEAYKDKHRDRSSRWRKSNPEKVTASSMRWQKSNPDKVSEYHKRWQRSEKAREVKMRWLKSGGIEYHRRWRESNDEKNRELIKRWRESNRGRYRDIVNRYKRSHRDQLGDYYVKSLIRAQVKLDDIPDVLIESKRLEIQLLRKSKE